MTNCKLKYVVLPAASIHNMCDAAYIPEFCSIPNFWQDEKLQNQLRQRYIELFNEKVGHYEGLEKDLLEGGFRNPVLVTAGYPKWRLLQDLPPYMRDWPEKDILICENNGGSRLSIAQKYDSDVPCLVSDWVNRFPEEPEITIDEAMEKFLDKPGGLRLTEKGLQIISAQHVHIQNPDYNTQYQSIIRKEIIKQILREFDYEPKKEHNLKKVEQKRKRFNPVVLKYLN